MNFRQLCSNLAYHYATLSSKRYIAYLRAKGVLVGEGTFFFGKSMNVDISRPHLVEIGNNCNFTDGVKILTHGYDWSVLQEKYGEILCSSGKVKIGDNVFVGTNAIILKGVTIGDNAIIGAGSVVTHDIPANVVAAGNPCRVIMGLEEYYIKRKKIYVEEAKAYALEMYRKTGKVPNVKFFGEELPLFVRRGEQNKLPKSQAVSTLDKFLFSKPVYDSFESFLSDAGVPIRTQKGKSPK